MEESLAASFMARTRLQGIVTAMNAGGSSGSSGAGASSSDGQPQPQVFDWISSNRVQMIIQVLSARPDEVVTREQKSKLSALAQAISQTPTASYQAEPKKVATGWLMMVRTTINNDDKLLQWAVDAMARAVKAQKVEEKEKAPRKRPIDDVTTPAEAPEPAAPTESWDDVYDRELAYVAGQIKTPPWQLAGAVLPELRWTYAQFVPVDDYESQVGWGKPDGHLFDYAHPFSEVNVNATAADGDDAGRQATQRSVVQEWVRLPANRTFRENNQTWRANWTNQQMQAICKYVSEHDDLHGHLSPDEKVAMAQHLHNQWIANLKEEARFWGANFTSKPQSGGALAVLEECRNHGIDPFADLSSVAYEPVALRNASQQHLFRARDFWAVHAMRVNVQQTDAWRNEHARLLGEYSAIVNDATKPHAERQQAADRHEATLCLQLTGHNRAPQRPTYPGGPSAQKQARPKARPWDGVRGENDKQRIKAAVAKDAGLEARIFQAWRDAGYRGRDEVVAHDDGTFPPAPLILAPLYKRIVDLLSASEAAMALLGTSGANGAGATERRERAVHVDLT